MAFALSHPSGPPHLLRRRHSWSRPGFSVLVDLVVLLAEVLHLLVDFALALDPLVDLVPVAVDPLRRL
eukprot:4156021-Pyramimonas_sp.AAC.1